ncbi:Crp/Fnr family transcriptional regulator [Mariprofundus ferrooxydans]|uniref:Cyclic nucleotide-binding:Bacterial regulatory protein, Crp n=1 Tax=Mariprofundus ferrooxydans PV-1 TaxID=314345 RepID=Q0EX27_9PROT|nr:Crp/Fnr family transcriptional regulator [Mariprofundus ferrooxydans]EAU53847.1 Cyclic nucleotide-binding:Bacterial regulatory protein, Crp [Mariprofundus ferrooxydans PV-1]KON47348.1 Crp/Fnr family transcriptional regulator [Mariprofundus ferrooxydans]
MIELLRKVPLFSELNEGELASIAKLASSIDVQKKNIVVQEFAPGDSMYVILSGEVKISTYSVDGREVVLALLGKGSFFGEMSLLDEQPRSATVTTMTDAKLAHIRRRDLVPLLMERPAITLKLLSEITSRLRRTSRVLERISSMDVPHRLYAYIVDHCHRFGQPKSDGRYSTVLPTHQLLADQLSTSRETISRAISTLKKEGILLQGDGRGKMSVDVDALEERIDDF